jgi:hypothetical protein
MGTMLRCTPAEIILSAITISRRKLLLQNKVWRGTFVLCLLQPRIPRARLRTGPREGQRVATKVKTGSRFVFVPSSTGSDIESRSVQVSRARARINSGEFSRCSEKGI